MEGIAVFGLNGSGKSTLCHILAKQLDYFEMDVEDYYFPEQKESRKSVLEKGRFHDTNHFRELPFSNPRQKGEVQNAMIKDMKMHPRFIISGVAMDWSEEILSRIDLAFWIQTPLEVCLKRIQSREEKRFGDRVLAGGDMFMQQSEFRNMVKNRDPKTIEENAIRLACPVIVIDGTLPVADNVRMIHNHLMRTI